MAYIRRIALALVTLVDRFALMAIAARSHSARIAKDRVLTVKSGEAGRTHAHGLDAVVLDDVDALAAVEALDMAACALGRAHRVLRVALTLAVNAVAAALDAAHVAALVPLLLAEVALVVRVAFAPVAHRARVVRHAHRLVHALAADALGRHGDLAVLAFVIDSFDISKMRGWGDENDSNRKTSPSNGRSSHWVWQSKYHRFDTA